MKLGGWSTFVCALGLITFHILLIVKVQSNAHFSWPVVFIPLWIAILFFMFFIWWLLNRSHGLLADALWLLTGGLTFLIFTIVLSIKLNGDKQMSWYGVFAPFWVTLAIFLLVDEGWPKYKHTYSTKHTSYGDYDAYEHYLVIFPKQGLVACGVYAILHALSLENHATLSWPIIFSPFFVLTVPNMNPYDNLLFPGLLALPFIIFEILLILYLEGKIANFAVPNIPLYILDIVLFVGSCVVGCAF